MSGNEGEMHLIASSESSWNVHNYVTIRSYNKIASDIKLDWNLCLVFSSVQSLSHVWLFTTTWTAAYQSSLSITNSQNLLKLKSKE